MITQSINLNMTPGMVKPRIWASQNDTGSRTFEFHLFNAGQAFTPAVSDSVLLNGTKPDSTTFSYACTKSGNVIQADCTAQMTALAGDVECEIRVVNSSEETVGSANFILSVELDPQDIANVSENELAALAILTAQGAGYAASAAQSASDASDSAASVSAAVEQITTNKNNITSLTTRMGTAEGNITSLQSGKLDKTDVVNDLTQTTTGKALDAVAGKTLSDALASAVTALSNTLETIVLSNTIGTPRKMTFNGGLVMVFFTTEVQATYDLSAHIGYIIGATGAGASTSNYDKLSIASLTSTSVSIDPTRGETTKYPAWIIVIGTSPSP